ncbi:MAG: sulfatase-like hydrolase/transferase [Pseudomonadota bacterium]
MMSDRTGRAKNLLVIISDEHRRDAMGCMGHPIVKTPHLDRLAAAGTIFDNAYTPSPICVPTRAALATGQYIHRTGHWDSAAPYAGEPTSWMHAVRETGADVASIGKLHFRSSNDDNGFSDEILPMHVVGEIGWTIGLLREDPPPYDAAAELAADVGPGESEYTQYDRAITEAACNWLASRTSSGKPWAGFVSFINPHYPLTAPEEFLALYRPEDMDLPIAHAPEQRPTHPELNYLLSFWDYDRYFDRQRIMQAKAAYYGLVSFMDDCVGKVLAALDQTGQRDETLIVYVSDHGDMMGDHGFWTKSVMYEASAGIPMIVAGPEIAAGRRSGTGAGLLDIAPTAAEVFGAEDFATALPGQSLVCLANEPDDRDRTVFSEYHDGGSSTGFYMVRWGDWKYIYYAGRPAQLFNLATDPSETNDLGLSDSDEAIAARADGERRLRDIGDPEAVNAEAFADQRRRIDALGGREACASIKFNHTPAPTPT